MLTTAGARHPAAPVRRRLFADVRWADALLVCWQLAITVLVLDLITNPPEEVGPPAPGPVLVIGALCLAQLPAVLLRHLRPRGALIGYSLLLPGLQFAVPVLAYAVARRGRPAGRLLAVALLAPIVPIGGGALLFVLLSGADLAGVTATAAARFSVRQAIGMGVLPSFVLVGFGRGALIPAGALQLAAMLVLGNTVHLWAGVALGTAARRRAARAERRRVAREQVRLAAAVTAERTRIADEIAGTVLIGLHRLVRGATEDAVTSNTSARLRTEARQVLDSLRRVLTVLRTPVPDAGDPPRRGPVAPTRSGVALALVVGTLVVAAAVLAGDSEALGDAGWGTRIDTSTPAFLIAPAVQLLALAWWRSAPVPALLAASAGSVVSTLTGSGNDLVGLAHMILFYAAGAGSTLRRSAAPVAACIAAIVGAWHLMEPMSIGWLLVEVVLTALVWWIGVQRGRSRRERRTREAGLTRAQVDAERLRVARDLHDVVAHHVSALAVQAGAAELTDDPAVLRRVAEQIAELGRRIAAAVPALAAATQAPPTVALDRDGVEQLVGTARAAGVPVTTTVSGTPFGTGDAEVFAQQIVVEALTNVVRHAGPSPTTVTVAHHDHRIVVDVQDCGPAPDHRPASTGSGMGVRGMRERAELLGGTLEADTTDRGFRVRATLPRPDVAAQPARSEQPVAAPVTAPVGLLAPRTSTPIPSA